MNDYDVSRIRHRLQQRAQQMTNAQKDDLALETLRSARDMARLGVSSSSTADIVCQALERRYGAKEMKKMRESFVTHSRNFSPTTLSGHYLDAIRAGKSVENLGSLGTSGAGGSSRGPVGSSGGSGGGHGGASGGGVGGHGGSSGGQGGKR